MDKALVAEIEAIRAKHGPAIEPEEKAEILRWMAEEPGPPIDWTKDLEEIWQSVPAEAWDELPDNFAINLDHYLYGSPKVEP